MSAILEMALQLRDVGEAIARHERAIARNSSPSLVAGLRSLQKRMKRLEEDFVVVTASVGVDVCRYRFFSDIARPTVTPICGALTLFQNAVTLSFNAITNGPQHVARVAPEIVEKTAFGFDYSFSGSLGIVLTFENEQFGLIQSAMDDAMGAIFEVASAKSATEIAQQGRRLGQPAIKAIYRWAGEHATSGFGADIQWVRGDDIKNRLLLQCEELKGLYDMLADTSTTEVEEIAIEGTFTGGEHSRKHLFHFVGDDGTDYKGKYEDAISEENPVQYPKRYRAHIKKTTRIFFASDEDDKPTYFLLRLDALP